MSIYSFQHLPDRENGGAWYSEDAITIKQVKQAIIIAKTKLIEAEQFYKDLIKNLSESEIESGWPMHESDPLRKEAALARISAVLLAALHIEGGINAWGVYVTGEEFYKAHIERCSIESKIALILALSGKGIIPLSHTNITSIQVLFERRNQIVHRKTKEINDVRKFQAKMKMPNTDFDICETALSAFHELVLNTDDMAAFIVGAKEEEDEA